MNMAIDPIILEDLGRDESNERVPGDYFRAMARLYLGQRTRRTPSALARDLRARLIQLGVDYKPNTLKRQISGAIRTVPRVVELAMQNLLANRANLYTPVELERALAAAGLFVPRAKRLAEFVDTDRVAVLSRMWLHLNPNSSKRQLAQRLNSDLLDREVSITTDSLQSILKGVGGQTRREVHEVLMGYLAEHGIRSEEEAARGAAVAEGHVSWEITDRERKDSDRFVLLARLWQLRHNGASMRQLATVLRSRLQRHGIQTSLCFLQDAVAGRTGQIRRGIEVALESLLREEIPSASEMEAALRELQNGKVRLDDLERVPSEPVAQTARAYLAANPSMSIRRLSVEIAREIQSMGYRASANSVYPVLVGGRKRIRGFVKRACMEHFRAAGIAA